MATAHTIAEAEEARHVFVIVGGAAATAARARWAYSAARLIIVCAGARIRFARTAAAALGFHLVEARGPELLNIRAPLRTTSRMTCGKQRRACAQWSRRGASRRR